MMKHAWPVVNVYIRRQKYEMKRRPIQPSEKWSRSNPMKPTRPITLTTVAAISLTCGGIGIALAQQHGLRIAFVTGRDSPVVARRAAELKVTELYVKCHDKLLALHLLAEKYELGLEEIAFVGDDLPDAAMFSHVGAGVAVANATEETKARAEVVTGRRGGEGALREVIELIFRCQGKWDQIVADALEGRGP